MRRILVLMEARRSMGREKRFDSSLPTPDDVTVQFVVPAWVVAGRGASPEAFACWVREAAAMFRYARGEITLGTAAALAGMTQAGFMRAAKTAGLATADEDVEALDREIAYLAGQRQPGGTGG